MAVQTGCRRGLRGPHGAACDRDARVSRHLPTDAGASPERGTPWTRVGPKRAARRALVTCFAQRASSRFVGRGCAPLAHMLMTVSYVTVESAVRSLVGAVSTPGSPSIA